MATREAIAAGSFYPAKAEEIKKQIAGFLAKAGKQEKAECVIAPHAGYIYSGQTAAYSFKALKESKCFVILGPNHTGLGSPISVSDADFWQTPLGKVPVNKGLRKKLLKKLGIQADGLAHLQEHSIEVLLPFLQHQYKDFAILPVSVGEHRISGLERLGKALEELGQGFSLVVSSDFTHNQPLEMAKEKDMKAISLIEKMDAKAFQEMVLRQRLTICGFAPITAAMFYCKKKGLKKGKLLSYDTSATALGDKASVVGYASIAFCP